MKITRDEIRNIAHLARLDIAEASLDAVAHQTGRILEYIDQLNQVDTTGVPPTSHASMRANAFRDDSLVAHLDRDSALANAPDEDDGSFIVPRVIG